MTIDLGAFGITGQKNVVTGLASNLDTQALVESLVAARQVPVTALEDKVTSNTSKLSAYAEMRSLLDQFKSAADALRNPPGFNTAGTNAFQSRQAFLTTNTTVAGSNYLGVSAGAGSLVGKHDITITNLAEAKTELSGTFTSETADVTEAASGTTAGMFSAGTFQINGTNVTIDDDFSLVDIRGAINGVSGTTGVSASIIKIADNDFRLQLQSNKTGLTNAYTITDTTGVLTEASFTQTQAAEDASITFNGQTITRSENTISDIVVGDSLTLSLFEETPVGTTVTAEIDEDTTAVKNAITTFVGAYNDFMIFAARQQERDENGNFKETAVLAQETPMRTAIDSIAAELSRVVSGVVGSTKTQLSDAGITFQDFPGDDETPAVSNTLTLDASVLDTALAADFEGVRKIFEFDFISDSSRFVAFSRNNQLNTTAFSIDLDASRAVGDQVRITYNDGTGNVTINADYTSTSVGNGTITGKAGTVLEGLTILYAGGDDTDTASVTVSQGIGDRVYNLLDDYLEDGGLLKVTETALQDENTDNNEEITDLNAKIETYRNRLLAEFAEVERAIAVANSTLQFLEAQSAARENS